MAAPIVTIKTTPPVPITNPIASSNMSLKMTLRATITAPSAGSGPSSVATFDRRDLGLALSLSNRLRFAT